MKNWPLVFLALTNLTCPAAEKPLAVLRTGTATIAISRTGALQELTRNEDGRNYLASAQPAPLLSVRLGGTLHAPDSATWNEPAKQLTLYFADPGLRAVVRAEAKSTHVAFELVELSPANQIELVVWGPYPTTIGDVIGEVVGVVRDDQFAIGIQALNAKTLGGYSTTENDIEADYTAHDHSPIRTGLSFSASPAGAFDTAWTFSPRSAAALWRTGSVVGFAGTYIAPAPCARFPIVAGCLIQ